MEDWLINDTSDMFKDDQPPRSNQAPLDWKYLIEETMASKNYRGILDDMNPTDAGNHIHEWLEDEFSEIPGLKWENFCSYENDEGEDINGKYDAFDGSYVYEFKTKFDHRIGSDLLPMEDDLEQVDDYLNALDTDYGVLVYIGRGDFEVEEYLVHR